MTLQSGMLASGKSGFKWGVGGKCYASKEEAQKEGTYVESRKELAEAVGKLLQRINKQKVTVNAKILKDSVIEEQRLFYAVVIEPMTQVTDIGDSHGDSMTAEEIEKSAHYYMEMGSTVFKNHHSKIEATVVESYIAQTAFTPEGSEEEIKKGSWVMTVKVLDDEIWEQVKSGEIAAFSPGGYAFRNDLE